MNFPVNEIFESIQGEGHWAGKPAVFVRFQGCAVGCPWCDTKHTWATIAGADVSIDDMLAKTADAPSYAWIDVDELVGLVTGPRFAAQHVVLTGGDPCAFDLRRLTSELLGRGRTVQVETSGTEVPRVALGAWLTVSPKVDMPGEKPLEADALAQAREIKMPVGRPADIDALKEILARHRPTAGVWLQPLSMSEKATRLCIAAATANNWRVSLQAHRFIGVR